MEAPLHPLTEPRVAPSKRAARVYALSLVGALIVLAGGIVTVYGRTLADLVLGPAAVPASTITYVSDLDFWQRTPREMTVSATARFDLDADLHDVPLTVGDWTGVEKPEENQEVLILLQPEQYVQRLYQNSQGQYLWLSMVGGRNSQPFHAPDICYDADGWQYNLGSHQVALAGGGSLYGLYLDAHKMLGQTRAEHVVLYFYLFPDKGRAISDGIVLFKLTSGRVGTVEETLAMQEDFVRQFFTSALPAADADAPDSASAFRLPFGL